MQVQQSKVVKHLLKITANELMKFNPETYAKLIKYLQQYYKLVPFREIPKENVPYVILRHDVDVSLPRALRMAEIEHSLGVKSTYFILISSKHYNSFDGENAVVIKRISALGHEIGLHYDPDQYKLYSKDPAQSLKMEATVLESFIDQKVSSVSCHAPRGPRSLVQVEDYINADDPSLRDVLVHDSERIWTIKSLTVLLNDHPQRVQLLTHPCLWIGETSRRTKLDDFLLDILLSLYRIRALAMRLIHSKESYEN